MTDGQMKQGINKYSDVKNWKCIEISFFIKIINNKNKSFVST